MFGWLKPKPQMSDFDKQGLIIYRKETIMKTQHTIKSLTDNKEIALSSKDLCKIVEYAIENDIVQIDIGVPNSKSMFSIKDENVF